MTRQLNLNRDQLDDCYETAAHIISQAFKTIERHSSVSVERATLMLLGLEEEYRGKPWAFYLIDSLTKDQLRVGAALWWGKALISFKEEPKKVAEKIARRKIKWEELPEVSLGEIKQKTSQMAKDFFKKNPAHDSASNQHRLKILSRFADVKARRLRNDVEHFLKEPNRLAVAELKGEIEDFRFAFAKSDRERTIPVVGGLLLAEETALSLLLGFRFLNMDGFYSIFEEGLNAERALVDLGFALSLSAKCGAQVASRHSALQPSPALLFLYEQMARRSNVPFANMALESSWPKEKTALTDPIAHAQFLREAFSQSSIWLKLEEKADPFSFFAAAFAESDGIFLPKTISLQEVSHWIAMTQNISQEFLLGPHGKIAREAHFILEQCWKQLKKIDHLTLWKFFDESKTLGKEGVFQKSYHYWNPITELCRGSVLS